MSSDQYLLGNDIRVTPGDADGRVLLNVETGRMYAVNGIGSVIVSGLQQRLSVEQIINAIAASCETPHDRVAEDVHAFLTRLAGLEIVQTRTPEEADGHSEAS